MELSKIESKRILRSLELKAYRNVVDALRAQGTLTKNKHEVLKNLAATLKVGEERCRSEIRRAVNDDVLNLVAQSNNGKNTECNWRNESVRKIPLMPMVAAQTAFTALADNIADRVALHNSQFSETTQPLNEILEARKNLTDENLSRYYSSKIFRPLLSNKKFKDEAILAELEKIDLRNKDPQSDDESEDCTESYTVPCEPLLTKSVTWDEQTLLNNRKSHQDSQNSENVSVNPEPNTLVKNNKTGVARKPVTKTTRGVRPEKSVQNVETSGLGGFTVHSSKRIISKPKRYEIEGVDDVPEVTNALKTNSTARTNISTKRKEPTAVKPTPVVNERTAESICNRSKSSRRRPRPGSRRRPSKISRIHKANSNQKIQTESELIEPRPFDNKPSRRKSNSVTIIDDFSEEPLSYSSNNKGVEPNNSINRTSVAENAEKTINRDRIRENSEETFSSGKQTDVSHTNAQPKSVASVLKDFELNLSPAQIEEDTRPHTFNLIPASRRFKLLQKRARSPNGEIVAFTKRVADENSMSANNISSDGYSNEVSSSSNNLSTSAMKNSKLSQLPSSKKSLSLLGSIKVRNLNAKPSDDEKNEANSNEKKISTCHPFMESSSDSLSDSESFNESKFKHGGFHGFITNGLPSPDTTDDSSFYSDEDEFSDMSENSIELSEVEGTKSSETLTKTTVNETLQVNDNVDQVPTKGTMVTEPPHIEQLIDIASADVILGDLDVSMSDGEAEHGALQNTSYDDIRVLTPAKATKAMEAHEPKSSDVFDLENTESSGYVTTVVSNENDKKNFIIIGAGKKSPRPVSEVWSSLEQKQQPPVEERIIRSGIFPSSVAAKASAADTAATSTSSGSIKGDIFDKIRTFRRNLASGSLANECTISSSVADAAPISPSSAISSADDDVAPSTAGQTIIAIPSSEKIVDSAELSELLVATVADESGTFVLSSLPSTCVFELDDGEGTRNSLLVTPRTSAGEEGTRSSPEPGVIPSRMSGDGEEVRRPKKARIIPPRSRFDKQIRLSPSMQTMPFKTRVDGDKSTARVRVLAPKAATVDDDEARASLMQRATTSTASDCEPQSGSSKPRMADSGDEDEENSAKSRIAPATAGVEGADSSSSAGRITNVDGEGKTKKSLTVDEAEATATSEIRRLLSSSSKKEEASALAATMRMRANTSTDSSPSAESTKTSAAVSKGTFSKSVLKPLPLPQIPKKVFQLYQTRDDEWVSSAPPSTIVNSKTMAVNADTLIEISSSKKFKELEISDDFNDEDVIISDD